MNRPLGWMRGAVLQAHAAPRRYGWSALLAVMLVVVAWQAVRPPSGAVTFALHDKLLHALAFAALAVPAGLLAAPANRRAVGWAALGLLAYGAAIEWVQSTLPYRSAEWADLLADAVGIATGLSVVAIARLWAAGPRTGRH